MSSRNGRRHRKKIDDETELKTSPSPSPRKDEKTKLVAEPIIHIPQVEEIEKTTEQIEVKKAATPIQLDVIEDSIQTETITITETIDITTEEVNENGNTSNGGCADSSHEMEAEIELQIVDTEVPQSEPELDTEEQELQKLTDDNSDIDSHKGSPILTDRCATRRSQTRNIPTPKTPRVYEHEEIDLQIEQNGKPYENDKEKQDDVICLTPISEEVITTQDVQQKADLTVPDGELHEIELPASHNVSCVSTLSTQVNVGSDVTREIDLSLPEENSFLNTAKDLNVVETLRRMSSRRAIRSSAADYRKTLLKSQAEKHEYVLQQQRVSVEPRMAAPKRKTRSKTPENPKRFKVESSPGFFSYISSPISMLRSRFASAESMSASTPKLTAYREQEDIADPELSKIEDTSKTPADRKRCVIM